MKIQFTHTDDIEDIVALSYQKRKYYEEAQPQFWKYAENAEKIQADWFRQLLGREDHILLSAKNDDDIVIGFIIGRVIPAPEVYDPGGMTLMIDDFCVEDESMWQDVGAPLIESIKEIGHEYNVSQILVVSGDHDEAKNSFLEDIGLSTASRWYVGSSRV
jgi:GNAT superfamily N-acetyltransferase